MHDMVSESTERALSYILAQRESFYGEAWDIHFGDNVALVGNQFGVSLVLDALLDACEHELVKPEDIKEDIGRLAATMKDGGWRYFPGFDIIPPDADDTAQMVQLLVRIHGDVDAPVSLLLEKENVDGSFKTWLQGVSGADVEVTANVLYALYMVDKKKYHNQLLRGAEFLISVQEPEGWWRSTWYYDKFYGTYVCLRILSRLGCYAAVERGHQFLVQSQNDDGGWGSNGSTAQDTAFSLLSLPSDHAEYIQKGIDYLVMHQRADGSWNVHPFFFTFGSIDKFDRPVIYKSKTVITACALRALLDFSWKKREQ